MRIERSNDECVSGLSYATFCTGMGAAELKESLYTLSGVPAPIFLLKLHEELQDKFVNLTLFFQES